MAEYASLRKIEFELCGGNLPEKYKAFIRRVLNDRNLIPAADVAPVVHSYWEHKITNDGENIGICHNCKYPVSWFWERANYCPNCGAKMDRGADL